MGLVKIFEKLFKIHIHDYSLPDPVESNAHHFPYYDIRYCRCGNRQVIDVRGHRKLEG